MTPYYEHGGVTLYHGDCREILLAIESVDAVVTDEPYAIGSGSAFVRQGGAVIAECGDETFNAPVVGWIAGAARTVCDGGYLASFTSRQRRHAVEREMAACGLIPWMPFYLVKNTPAPTPRPVFSSAVEECAISYRGVRRWFGGGATPNCWIGRTPAAAGTAEHPCAKPVEAMSRIVYALTPPGGVVLDPFAGSGTTLVAAKNLGRRAIGIEIEERYCEIAAKRLAQEVLPL